MRDSRGVVYVETLIAFLPVFSLFAATLQLADLSAAQLVVQHASTTAARAAAVVLPDDGAYYGDRDNQGLHRFGGARQGDIEQAADLILRANTRLDATGANVALDKASYANRDDLTATVAATFRCLLPIVCGGDLTLQSESKLVYQGAKYVYDPTTLGDVRPRRPPSGRPPTANEPDPSRPQDPDRHPPDEDDRRPPVADKPTDGRPPAVADNRRPPAADEPNDGPDRNPKDAIPSSIDKPAAPPPPVVADNGRPGTRDPSADDGKPLGPVAMAEGPPRCVGDACSVGSGRCFAAGTLVHTARGDRPIESIRRGDLVWSRSPETGELALRPVVQRFVTPDQAVLELHLRGPRADERVQATPAHRFWVERTGWVQAEALGRSADLWSPEGPVAGSAGEVQFARVTVYNLEVEGFHTYFVGALHAWVHNDCEIRKEYAPELKNRQDLRKKLASADETAQADPAKAESMRREAEQKLAEIREIQGMSDAALDAEARNSPVTSDRSDRINEVQYERYRRQREAEGKKPKTFNRWYASRNPSRQDARARKAFRGQMTRIIARDPNHPLRFLLDERGRLRVPPGNLRTHPNLIGRSEELPPGEAAQRGPATPAELGQRDDAPWYVEAGHRTSQHSGEPEFLGLQDAWQNQYEATDEARSQAIYDRNFIDIGGVPVELATARAWEEAGLLPAGTVPPPPQNERERNSPPFVQGWSVSDWNDANPPR